MKMTSLVQHALQEQKDEIQRLIKENRRLRKAHREIQQEAQSASKDADARWKMDGIAARALKEGGEI